MAKRKHSGPTGEDDTKVFERLLRNAARLRHHVLKLYVTGSTARSAAAISNIRSVCDEFLGGKFDLEVVDIYQQPDAARGQQIIAAPTLVKESPRPVKRLVGDLGSRQRILLGLNLIQSRTGAKTEGKWAKA